MGIQLFALYLLFSIPAWALECPTGTHHVRRHPRRAYQRADGTSVNATTVSESCRTSTSADVKWTDKLKSGVPPNWQSKNEKVKAWTEDERERVLEALSEIPQGLWPDVKIYRFAKSVFFPNPASYFDGSIVLYDSAFTQGNRIKM